VIDRELPVAAAHEAFGPQETLIEPDQMLELEGILVELLDEAAQRAGSLS
jgi:hypothetical protein